MLFILDRMKVHLRDSGVRHDFVNAVRFPTGVAAEDDLVRLLARVDALQKFLATEDGENLLVAYRRASNIVRIEEQRDKQHYDGGIDNAFLKEPAERELNRALDESAAAAERALTEENFEAAMAALASLRGSVDGFFDRVTVNSEDAALRANRLRLLSRIRATMNQVADFSQIEG